MKNKKKSESYGIIIAKDDDKEKLFSSQKFSTRKKIASYRHKQTVSLVH